MKILLEIKDDKADFMMELLHNFKFVKASPLTKDSLKFIKGLIEAVEEVNLVKAGRKKTQPLNEFLDEL